MPTSSRSLYLLLLRQPPGGVPPPEELRTIMAQFTRWMDNLRKKGLLEGSHRLELTGKVLRRGRRRLTMTDGPYAEAKEVVGGYVMLSAKNLNEAIKAARACPGLAHGVSIEIRPVQP